MDTPGACTTLAESRSPVARSAEWGADLQQPDQSTFQSWDIRELLGDCLPSSVQGAIRTDAKIFDPSDAWAAEFRIGLRLAELFGVGLEVGMGSGANIIDLLARNPAIEKIFGSDKEAAVSETGAKNVRQIEGIDANRFELIPGTVDLMTGIEPFLAPLKKLQFVVGCIPQVRESKKEGSARPDFVAHYFNGEVPPGYEGLNRYHLTLNARFLAQAAQWFEPHKGTAVLNLAGRVPRDVLEDMFVQFGYKPTVIHKAVVTQDRGTALDQLIKSQEEHGIKFRFCRTKCFTTPTICAREADEIIHAGEPVYHELFVIKGLYVGN